MSTLRTSILLDLAGNLESRARRYGQALGDMSSRGQRSMGVLRSSAASLGRGLDSLGNRYTALLTGAAGIGAAKMVMDLQRRFTRLAIQAGIADDEVKDLKRSIYDAAQAPDIRVDPGEITSAVEAIVEKTGDLDFARANIRNIGLAIQATGAAGRDIGGLLAEFQKQGIDSSRAVLQALDTLTEQGKMGAFTLQNLAALGPRVVTAYTAMGRSGPQAMREMGAALQMIMMGTGNAEQAATAFEATLRTLADPAKIKLLERIGIKLWDPAAAERGQRVLRPINELMSEIIRKAGGDKVKLNSIFGDEASRAFNQATAEFMKRGELGSLEKFVQVQGDGSQMLADSTRAARDASAAMTNLYTVWKNFADKSLTEPITAAADALNALGSETTGKVIKGLAIGAGGLGVLVALRKTFLGVRGLAGMVGLGRRGAVGAATGGLGGLPVPLPVYVVNSRMSLMPDQYGGGAAGGTAGKAGPGVAGKSARGGWLGKGAKFLRRASASPVGRSAGWFGAALDALLEAPRVINAWTNDQVSTRQAWGTTARAGLSMGGTALGATIGSFLLPGLGTMLGGMAGGWLGDLAGQFAETFIAEPTAKAEQPAPEARLRVEVSDERVRVRTVESRDMDVDADTGQYMGAY